MSSYAAGQQAALLKFAAPDEQPKKSRWLRNTLAAGAAAAPFAGLIGQQKKVTGFEGPRMTKEEFLRAMQPGDVLMSGHGSFDVTKGIVNLASGSPENYHAAVVVDNKGNIIHSQPYYGLSKGHIFDQSNPGDRLQILRRKDMTPEDTSAYLKHLEDLVASAEKFKKEVAAQAAARGYSKRQQRDIAWKAREALYDNPGGARGGVRHLFKPKTLSMEAIEAERAHIHELRRRFAENPGQFAPELLDRVKELEEKSKSPVRQFRNKMQAKAYERYENNPSVLNELAVYADDMIPGTTRRTADTVRTPDLTCIGGVCSTVPATALPKGKVVVPGKPLSETMPSDFLRNEAYESVAIFDPQRKRKLNDKLLTHAPMAVRAGMGALGAASVLGGSKILDKVKARIKKKPAVK